MTTKNQKTNRHNLFKQPRPGRPFQRGDFKYIILEQIQKTPSCGYEIIRALEERFHNFYTPSPGSVYPTLQMLEEMGYAEATEQEGKKVFSITPEGDKFLNEQKEFKERVRRQIRRWWNPDNIEEINEMMGEFDSLARMLRDKARTADSEKLTRMRKVITEAQKELSKF